MYTYAFNVLSELPIKNHKFLFSQCLLKCTKNPKSLKTKDVFHFIIMYCKWLHMQTRQCLFVMHLVTC